MDVNEELKFLWKKNKTKKVFFFVFFLGGGVGLGGVRVDVNEELKFWGKFTKKNSGGGGR